MGSVGILVRLKSNLFGLFGFGIRDSRVRIWDSRFGFRKFLQFCYIIGLRDVTGQNDI